MKSKQHGNCRDIASYNFSLLIEHNEDHQVSFKRLASHQRDIYQNLGFFKSNLPPEDDVIVKI